jgi:hypothetical protein
MESVAVTKNSETAAGDATVADHVDNGALHRLASQVMASLKTLGLHGKGVSGTRDRCNMILKSPDTKKQVKAAGELAASLRKGNAEAQGIAAALDAVLQGRPQAAGPETQDAPQVPATDTTQPVLVGAADGTEQRDEIVVTGAAEAQQPSAVRWMKPSDIRTAEPFSNLLPVNPKTRAAIAENMRSYGYDPASPVPFWEERGVAVDAHTRILAACDAGLERIPVVPKSFASEDEAVRYAVHAQVARRNLSDAEIVRLVAELDKRRQRGGARQAGAKTSSGAIDRSSKQTAELLHTSSSKVEKARAVNDSGDAALQARVASGEVSLNQAAKTVRARKPTRKPGADSRASAVKSVERAVQQLETLADGLTVHGERFKSICAKLRDLAAELQKLVAEAEAENNGDAR